MAAGQVFGAESPWPRPVYLSRPIHPTIREKEMAKKFIGWKLKNPPAPKPAPAVPAAVVKSDSPEDKQRKQWRLEKNETEKSLPSPPWKPEQPHQLLDDLSDDLSPEDRNTIILTRIQRMTDES